MSFRIAVIAVVLAALAGAWWLLQSLGMPADLSPDTLAKWLGSKGSTVRYC